MAYQSESHDFPSMKSNLRATGCRGIVSRYWRMGTWSGLPVYVQETQGDQEPHVIYYHGKYWWIYQSGAKTYTAVSSAIAEEDAFHFDLLEWFVGKSWWKTSCLQVQMASLWLMSQYNEVREQVNDLKEQLEQHRLQDAPQWPGSDTGVPKWGPYPPDHPPPPPGPSGPRETRFPNQNSGVLMGWLNRMVALIGAIKSGDSLRAGQLMDMLLVYIAKQYML
jgi:hypothetical protein